MGLFRPFLVPSISRPLVIGLIPLIGVTGLACSMAMAAYGLRLLPAQDRLAQAETAYHAALRTQATLQANRKRQEQLLATKQQLEAAWRSLPTETEFASLALAISELGRTERVTIPAMQYGIDKQKEGGLPVKASLSFSVTGEYAAVYRFIHRLESTDSYVVIESLDARRTQKQDKKAGLPVVFNVKVATFLRPNPPTRSMS